MDTPINGQPAVDPRMAELNELRAKRAKLAEARTVRNTPTMDALIEAEKRALADDELVDRFEAEVGPQGKHIAAIRSPVGLVVVRRPHRATFKRFQDKGSTKTDDIEMLVKPCLLHPDKAAFDAMVEQLPALLTQCGNECVTLAGVRTEELQSK